MCAAEQENFMPSLHNWNAMLRRGVSGFRSRTMLWNFAQ
jgi:hypothetical protein